MERQALHPQVRRLRQRRPRVLRRKRDCTPPSSSLSRGGLLPRLRGLRRRKDWHTPFLLTLPGTTSEEEGTGPPPHTDREYLGGGRQAFLLTPVGEYFMHTFGENDELIYVLTYTCGNCRGQSSSHSRIMQIVTSAVRHSYNHTSPRPCSLTYYAIKASWASS